MNASDSKLRAPSSADESLFVAQIRTAPLLELSSLPPDISANEILFEYGFRYRGNVLHYCCYEAGKGDRALAVLELSKGWGVDLSQADRPYHRMPIHYACWRGYSKVVSQLLKDMDDSDLVRQEDHFGWNCLHWAAYRNNVRVVEKLLAKKSYIDWFSAIDKKGRTPLAVAEEFHATKVVDIIKKYEKRLPGSVPASLAVSTAGDDDQSLGCSQELQRDEIIQKLQGVARQQMVQIQLLEKENVIQREEMALLQQGNMRLVQEIAFLQQRVSELLAQKKP